MKTLAVVQESNKIVSAPHSLRSYQDNNDSGSSSSEDEGEKGSDGNVFSRSKRDKSKKIIKSSKTQTIFSRKDPSSSSSKNESSKSVISKNGHLNMDRLVEKRIQKKKDMEPETFVEAYVNIKKIMSKMDKLMIDNSKNIDALNSNVDDKIRMSSSIIDMYYNLIKLDNFFKARVGGSVGVYENMRIPDKDATTEDMDEFFNNYGIIIVKLIDCTVWQYDTSSKSVVPCPYGMVIKMGMKVYLQLSLENANINNEDDLQISGFNRLPFTKTVDITQQSTATEVYKEVVYFRGRTYGYVKGNINHLNIKTLGVLHDITAGIPAVGTALAAGYAPVVVHGTPAAAATTVTATLNWDIAKKQPAYNPANVLSETTFGAFKGNLKNIIEYVKNKSKFVFVELMQEKFGANISGGTGNPPLTDADGKLTGEGKKYLIDETRASAGGATGKAGGKAAKKAARAGAV
jgi:hypothetical protein